MPNRPTRDEWAIRLMEVVATRSEDPSTQVGCVITDEQGKVVSTGYNGLPRGLSTATFTLSERPIKYQHVVHADANAILFAERYRLVGATMYVPFETCCDCSKLIIQTGIKEVVYKNHYEFKDPLGGQFIGLQMMLSAGIIVRQFQGPTHELDLMTMTPEPLYGGEGVVYNE